MSSIIFLDTKTISSNTNSATKPDAWIDNSVYDKEARELLDIQFKAMFARHWTAKETRNLTPCNA